MLVPCFSASTRSASRRTAKCPERVGLATVKCLAISPAVIGRTRSSSRMCLRVGSARALRTMLIENGAHLVFRQIAKYGRQCKGEVSAGGRRLGRTARAERLRGAYG